jgi:hypothetical protein
MTHAFLMAVVLVTSSDADVKRLYDVSTEGTSATVKAGGRGAVVIAFKTRDGAHVSAEAPLKIELSSKDVKLDRARLALADSVVKGEAGAKAPPDPRFEVGFTAASPGRATIDAKLTFFICTETLCARQAATLALPVEVQ